jgi:hypothetical protein
MILEVLKFLKGEFLAAEKSVVVEDGPKVVSYLRPDGSVVRFAKDIPNRDHTLGSLSDLIDFAKTYDASSGQTVVWFCDHGVQVVLDDDDHRCERGTLLLQFSETFKTLQELAKEKPFLEPKPFLRLLRIDLAGTIDPKDLAEKVKKVKFENGVSTSVEINRNKESLGRSITSAVDAGGVEIPETVVLNVPVYSASGESEIRTPVLCSVEVDSTLGRFRLLPLPGELAKAITWHIESIRGRLLEALEPEGIKVFCGLPQ